MWHRRRRRRLGLGREHREALLNHLLLGLLEKGRIRTTYARAKEASRFADRMVTLAKRGDLHARRRLVMRLRSPAGAKRLIEEIAPLFKNRSGGYTRVIQFRERPGDGAAMAFLEFTEVLEKPVEEKKKRKKEKEKEKKKEKPALEKKPKVEKAPEAVKEEPSQEETPTKEEQKKGGFLTKLRHFLTGE